MGKKIDEVFPIVQECSFCCEEFSINDIGVLPYGEWCMHYGCCTHDCLEREFDYDGFKKVFKKASINGLCNSSDWERLWKSWVAKKFYNENGHKSIIEESVFYAKDYDHREELIYKLADFGMDFYVAHDIVWKADFKDSYNRVGL